MNEVETITNLLEQFSIPLIFFGVVMVLTAVKYVVELFKWLRQTTGWESKKDKRDREFKEDMLRQLEEIQKQIKEFEVVKSNLENDRPHYLQMLEDICTLSNKIDRFDKTQLQLAESLKLLLADRILYLGQRYYKNKKVSLEDKAMLDKLYENYMVLGDGNPAVSSIYNKVSSSEVEIIIN